MNHRCFYETCLIFSQEYLSCFLFKSIQYGDVEWYFADYAFKLTCMEFLRQRIPPVHHSFNSICKPILLFIFIKSLSKKLNLNNSWNGGYFAIILNTETLLHSWFLTFKSFIMAKYDFLNVIIISWNVEDGHYEYIRNLIYCTYTGEHLYLNTANLSI